MQKQAQQPALAELPSLRLKPEKRLAFNRNLRVRLANRTFRYFCIASAVLLIAVLFFIIYFVGNIGFLTFKDVSFREFFFSANWVPEDGKYGAASFLVGTLSLTALTMLIALPVSLCLAVFLSEIAPQPVKRVLRPLLDLIVGIPSVVFGYIGLTVLIPLLRHVFHQQLGFGLMAAALVLAFMILPTISRVSDDAISAVPRKYRDAAYALGSTRLQVIVKVVLPAASRGIMTAIILGMARAIGETMAVVMVIGNADQMPSGLFSATSVLTSTIVMNILNVPFDSTWSHALYMMAFLLLLISIVFIILIRLIRSKGSEQV